MCGMSLFVTTQYGEVNGEVAQFRIRSLVLTNDIEGDVLLLLARNAGQGIAEAFEIRRRGLSEKVNRRTSGHRIAFFIQRGNGSRSHMVYPYAHFTGVEDQCQTVVVVMQQHLHFPLTLAVDDIIDQRSKGTQYQQDGQSPYPGGNA